MDSLEEDKKKPHDFSLFRYQMYVNEPFQPDLNGIGGVQTAQELKEKRNGILRELLHLLPDKLDRKNHRYQVVYQNLDATQYLLSVEAKRSKKVTQNRQNKRVSHEPFAWIAIDTDDDVQAIAIAQASDLRIETVIKHLTSDLQKLLSHRGLEFIVNSIKREDGFWEYVRENKNTLKEVIFSINPPNMPALSQTVGSQLSELIKSTQAKKADLSLNAKNGDVLSLEKRDARLRHFVDYMNMGGGNYKFKLRGSSRLHSPDNIQKILVATPQPESQLLEVSVESPHASVLTRIRVEFKIAP